MLRAVLDSVGLHCMVRGRELEGGKGGSRAMGAEPCPLLPEHHWFPARACTQSPCRRYNSWLSECALYSGPSAGQDSFALVFDVDGVHGGIMDADTLVITAAPAGSDVGVDSPGCAAGAIIYNDIDLFGGDLSKASYFAAATWEECCAFCTYSSVCLAW